MSYLFRGRGKGKDKGISQDTMNPNATHLLPETTWVDESLPSGIPPEGHVVVTISRQFGSGGAEIGRIVARESGLQYVDHEIIDEVARRLGVTSESAARQDEQTAGAVRHILDAIHSTNPFTMNYTTLFTPPQVPAQSTELAYFRLTQKVILELATEGNVVIVGRGSQFLLHSSPRTLHISIFAPLPYRIENVMKHFQLDRTQAIQLIERRDYEHDSYLRHYYGSNGQQPGLYHLLINTSLFSFELAANLVQQALPIVQEMS
ncbi:MAG TPA: cytidylate kinase-like family protein, partial [Ktedonobacteraceae bacterium]|nr:cytidylate kinase-like family protein [Ktedonobacteraceae bacterium]